MPNREVVIPPHRADVRLDNGRVIEFQRSPLSPEQIREREEFYGDMIWVVDATDFRSRMFIAPRTDVAGHPFVWLHMRQSWTFASKPVVLDIDDMLFHVTLFPEADGIGLGRWLYVPPLLSGGDLVRCDPPLCSARLQRNEHVRMRLEQAGMRW